MALSKPFLSLVTPCYNEEDAIPHVLEQIAQMQDSPDFRARFRGLEVIVVDDASSDNGPLLLKQYSFVKTIVHRTNKGYGAALKTGFNAAKGDFIFFFDIDGSYDTRDVVHMYDKLLSAQADVVFGNRIHSRQGMPWWRRLGNLFFTYITKIVFRCPIGDVVTGSRIFRRHLTKRLLLPDDDWNYSLALTIFLTKSGLKITEHPISYHPRLGQSKLNSVTEGLAFLKLIAKSI